MPRRQKEPTFDRTSCPSAQSLVVMHWNHWRSFSFNAIFENWNSRTTLGCARSHMTLLRI